MTYLDRLALEIQQAADPATAPADANLTTYRLYAVLLLAKGTAVTAEDVHNAWVAWASTHNPTSPYLVPFTDLTSTLQHRDEPFAAAIRAVAARHSCEY